MRRSPLILLAVAATALAFVPSGAGAASAKPLITDAKGDARALGSGYDIVSADLYTTGTTKKVGKKTVYTPTKLVLTTTFAAPPSSTPGATYNVYADVSACDNGSFNWYYQPGNTLYGEGQLYIDGCGESDATGTSMFVGEAYPVVKGSTITWTMPLKAMGPDLPLGTTFTNFRVYADQNEPVANLVGTTLVNAATEEAGLEGTVDTATSKAVYRLK